jgi:hypothetical protein
VLALAAYGQEPPLDWTIDSYRWAGTLAPSSRITVLNPHGDVRLRDADAGEVAVSAMIQRRTSDPVKAEVRIRRRWGRLRIEVLYPAAPQGDLHRVDLTIFVPARVRIAARTKDGRIEARGLENDLDFVSAGGDVAFSTIGTARVSTARGDITAELRGGWRRAPRLVARHGDITLRLPPEADARVRIRATGEVAVRRQARFERRTGRKTIIVLGGGAHSLFLNTPQGGVTLLAP